MSKEAMKLALDYIVATNKNSEFWLVPSSNLNKTVTALREALAEQPAQQKPVIRVNLDMTGAMATLPKTPSESVVEYKPVISDVGTECNIDVEARFFPPKGTGKITLHESKPAQRTWVGLTDEEIAKLDLSAVTVKDATSDVRTIEAKLKEKNT
jgi:hypothetical protein